MTANHVYVVTGAAGFVGRHLCRYLRAQGADVRGLCRRPDAALDAMGVQVTLGDLREPASWSMMLDGAEYVIHCAARASFTGRDCHADNVDGTRQLLNAITQPTRHVRRLVFVSTIGAIDRAPADACVEPLNETSSPHPTSHYGKSKWTAECLVRESGLPYCIVRPAMVVGRDMRPDSHFAVFARAAVNRSPLAWFAWPGELSVVHVDDLAAALATCAVHPDAASRTFFCSGSPARVADVFARANSSTTRLPVNIAAAIARRFPSIVPFKAKALLLPALAASDAPLQSLGWTPQKVGPTALDEVIEREQVRADPKADPGGQTVITGAASGLGRALALRLAPVRQNLLLVDRDRAGLEQLCSEIRHARTAVLDLANATATNGFLASPPWRSLPVRELYACAGFGLRGSAADLPVDAQVRMFQVNVMARLALAHAVIPDMIREGFGRIVLVSSSSAFQPLPYMAAYAASNAALLSLGEAWAAELSHTGVRILTVCPGGMSTNFQATAGVRQVAGERLMSPDAVAKQILQSLERTRTTTLIISGRARAMSILARVLPRRQSVALWKRLMSRLR